MSCEMCKQLYEGCKRGLVWAQYAYSCIGPSTDITGRKLRPNDPSPTDSIDFIRQAISAYEAVNHTAMAVTRNQLITQVGWLKRKNEQLANRVACLLRDCDVMRKQITELRLKIKDFQNGHTA